MSNTKTINFESIEEALAELNAEDRGKYFICTCPECERNEAFIYKNNPNFIQCNRENSCGERMILEFHEKVSEKDLRYEHMSQDYPELSKQQIAAMDWTVRAFKNIQDSIQSKVLDNGYRGISKEVSKEFIVDLDNKNVAEYMLKRVSPLLGKDYSDNDWMRKRNIVFPIISDDNTVDRILLRSTTDPNIEPKEIQLVMNPSKDTKDFFIDVPDNAETIVITEALLDGLSYREIDRDVGFVALTGASKTRKVIEYLKGNKEMFEDKNILLAFDDDGAGWRATDEFVSILESEEIGNDWNVFTYPTSDKLENVKDPNDFLQRDRDWFRNNYKMSISTFKVKSPDRDKEIVLGLER